MRKVIVTTTVNPVTEAIRSYDRMEGWDLIVVGDRKTPDYKLERGIYVSWEAQKKCFSDLCGIIGPDSVARGRMIAFILAHQGEYDIVASIDDDNYPLKNWGEEILVGKRCLSLQWVSKEICFDPIISYTTMHHRGFPLGPIGDMCFSKDGKITPKIQVNLWDGDGDVNAFDRIGRHPNFHLRRFTSCFTNSFSPFNTQNTIFDARYMKDHFANIPFIGRSDDIWAGYIFEKIHPGSVIYCSATVEAHQDRSTASIIQDLEDEIFGYKNTLAFLECLDAKGVDAAMSAFLPEPALRACEAYRGYFK